LSTKLLDRQAMLQTEADVVLLELNLEPTLRAIGTPVRVGSSALGLMTRRDIDITVVCAVLDASVRNALGELGRQLLHEQRVRTLRFKNDCGAWNISSKYPDGLYLGIEYRAASGDDWTLDLWFVDAPDRQPDLAHLKALPSRLSPRVRETILAIKAALATEATDPVSSFLVYEAVLDGGVTDLAAFRTWMARA
jgi:hypothetical protein